jgi:roadblock/LC7 domain-containing protein
LCLTELVSEKFGKEKLDRILAASGLSDSKTYMRYFNGLDFSDEKFVEMVHNLCKILNITGEQAADAFGQYWVCEYAPRQYPHYYKNIKSAEDFLMKLDSIHLDVTANSPSNIEAARPPRFDVKRVDKNTLRIHYKSKRRMIDFYIGLVRGVGVYFNTPIEIQKLSEEEVDIRLGPPAGSG